MVAFSVGRRVPSRSLWLYFLTWGQRTRSKGIRCFLPGMRPFDGDYLQTADCRERKPAAHNAFVMGDYILTETLRDLIQCVQAARDGASDQSLFAMQCDLVLHRAAQVAPGACSYGVRISSQYQCTRTDENYSDSLRPQSALVTITCQRKPSTGIVCTGLPVPSLTIRTCRRACIARSEPGRRASS